MVRVLKIWMLVWPGFGKAKKAVYYSSRYGVKRKVPERRCLVLLSCSVLPNPVTFISSVSSPSWHMTISPFLISYSSPGLCRNRFTLLQVLVLPLKALLILIPFSGYSSMDEPQQMVDELLFHEVEGPPAGLLQIQYLSDVVLLLHSIDCWAQNEM